MQFVPLWDSILDSLKMHRIAPEVIGKWTWILACAQRHDKHTGTLPDIETLTFWLRRPEEEVKEWLNELIAVKLVDKQGKTYAIHDWNQWRCKKDRTAKERMKRMRERKKNEEENGHLDRNVTRNNRNVTPPVTEQVAPPGYDDVTRLEKKRREHSSLRSECVRAEPAVTPEAVSADTHTHQADLVTGREPGDHADFLRAVEILESHESTARLGGQLVMHADTPGVTMFEGWRLIVAAMVAQRPDKTKSWNALLSFARQATLDEFDKLTKKLPPGFRVKIHDPGPTNQPAGAQNPPEGLEQFTAESDRLRAIAKSKGVIS